MKYEEKIQKAKACVIALESGKPLEQIIQEVADEGYYSPDRDAIKLSMRNMLIEKYGDQVKSILLNPELPSEMDSINPEIYETIQEPIRQQIILDAKRKAKQLLYKGSSETEIIEICANQIITKSEIESYLDSLYKHSKKSKKPEPTLLYLGILVSLIGIGISYHSYSSAAPGESYSIYFKMILGGIVLMVIHLVRSHSASE